jgi:dolichol-phosphate mannosyltransferase
MISVVLPSYNEEKMIPIATERIGTILGGAGIDYELLFVDDGSRDGTWREIQRCSASDPHVVGVHFSRNFGKEAAMFAGLEQAKGDCVVVMDCDLQHPPEKIVDMYRLWEEGYEVVEGIKSKRGRENPFYKLFCAIFYGIMSSLMKMDLNKTSDFKLLDRKVVEALLDLPERNTFFRALSFWAGFKSTSVTFDVAERKAGKSKWSFSGLVKYAISNTTSFTTAPLKAVFVLGVLLMVFSLVLGVETLVNYFLNIAADGFTTVILLLLIIGGCIMISLGIMGHYLARIYEEVKGRPRYIVSRTTSDED